MLNGFLLCNVSVTTGEGLDFLLLFGKGNNFLIKNRKLPKKKRHTLSLVQVLDIPIALIRRACRF